LAAAFFSASIMNKENVIDKLKTINYPGFSRDIVSFGMVKDVIVDEKVVIVYLNITSQNETKKQEIVKIIKQVLSEYFLKVSIEISGDAPSQAPPIEAQQQAHPAILDNVKHVIAIASGKGGVGKSTVAANLACAMAIQGKKVGLLDLDIYGPSLPIVLGLNEQPEMTQDKKLIPLEKFGMKVMSFGFISGNETPVIWRGPLVARMTEQFFRDVKWGELDVMILDLPPGTGDIQLTLTQKLRMSGAVMVTTPQDIALADVRKGADMFRKVNTPVLGVIENMSGLVLEGEVEGDVSAMTINGENVDLDNTGKFSFTMDLFKTGGGKKESERLGVPLLGKIPISPEIMSATDAGVPVAQKDPDSSLGQLYHQIAQNLLSSLD
jgi:ATP-binding protein involved in chromosome partitioning